MIGDGQVSMGSMVVKGNALKVRRIGDGVLVGFAGATADAFTSARSVFGPRERRRVDLYTSFFNKRAETHAPRERSRALEYHERERGLREREKESALGGENKRVVTQAARAPRAQVAFRRRDSLADDVEQGAWGGGLFLPLARQKHVPREIRRTEESHSGQSARHSETPRQFLRLPCRLEEHPGQLTRACASRGGAYLFRTLCIFSCLCVPVFCISPSLLTLQVDLAKAWRTDKYLRRLEATLLVPRASRVPPQDESTRQHTTPRR